MNTVLLNVANECVKFVDVEPKLSEYYRLLDCDLIDITTRVIGGRQFDVMCDDEGLFKQDRKVSAVDGRGNAMFVGNLMFFHTDEDGRLVGLTDEEMSHIASCVGFFHSQKHPDGYPIVTGCEYV